MICVYLNPTKVAEAQRLPVTSITTLLQNNAVQHCISLVDANKCKERPFFRQVCEVSNVAFQY